jgi:NAD(P)-dependent dehydrogenase (short-subunit alcohol dehydrogenase family)
MVAFSGAHVVVTGGTGALGTAVVGALRQVGAICHVTNFAAHELDHFAYNNDPDVHVTSGIELADEAAVTRFYASLPPLWASIHIAGGFAMAPIAETTAADFEAQFRMNTLSAFLCSRAAVTAIRARGDNKGGRIVNVAARPGIEPRLGAGMVAYATSKAAVAAFTQALGEELAGEEIWVNAVAPSIIDTPANRAAMPDAPHQRWVAPAALAELIVFLASPDNRVTRGAVVPIYAGV